MGLTWTLTVTQALLLVVFLQTGNCCKLYRNITWNQFSRAITENKFPKPSLLQYNGFIKTLVYADIKTMREAAMFLAQLIHGSGGLQYKEELAYKDSNENPYKSPLDAPGKKYFGRGYMQLAWAENYLAASQDIFGDDRLLQHPELVADDEDIAFKTSGWYWKKHVAVVEDVKKGKFGASTRAINGVLECNGDHLENSKNRFKYYTVVFKIFKVEGEPDESGCYN